MKIPFYQLDAFTATPFHGNPAGVCLLDEWLEDEQLQAIAAENNLSETAFVLPSGDRYELRWFTPKIEVDLCGHATLASAFVVFETTESDSDRVVFETRSGLLTVTRADDLLSMDFPAWRARPISAPPELVAGLGVEPKEVLRVRDFLAVYDSQEVIRSLRPDMDQLAKLDCLGVIVTAPGVESDFVSRFFAPRVGVPEDPVTGSAHCTLIPYWAERLGKTKLHALQLSERGGEIFCEHRGDRVSIAGRVVPYLSGVISI